MIKLSLRYQRTSDTPLRAIEAFDLQVSEFLPLLPLYLSLSLLLFRFALLGLFHECIGGPLRQLLLLLLPPLQFLLGSLLCICSIEFPFTALELFLNFLDWGCLDEAQSVAQVNINVVHELLWSRALTTLLCLQLILSHEEADPLR